MIKLRQRGVRTPAQDPTAERAGLPVPFGPSILARGLLLVPLPAGASNSRPFIENFYSRPKSLSPKMMNADMDGMFFIFLDVCSWFCGTYIALLSNGKSRESIFRRLGSWLVYLFIIPHSSRKDLGQLPCLNCEC